MKKNLIPEVQDAYTVEMERFDDNRGYFEEVYSIDRYPLDAYQINISRSGQNVVRGMHVVPFAKLCTCVRGSLFDVVADVREDSPTYLRWYGVWLTENNRMQLYVPPGCAHGFFAAENDTILLYLQDATYNPGVEREVNWRDPKLGIKWPYTYPMVHESEPPADPSWYTLSSKDREAPFL